jgi:hypothetical protein
MLDGAETYRFESDMTVVAIVDDERAVLLTGEPVSVEVPAEGFHLSIASAVATI